MSDKQALVVTTSHRGVFFGYGRQTNDGIITLKRARMCVYWSAETRGVMGLAVKGPNSNCKVGPAVPSVTLQGVTAVMECSPEAAKQWESEPWR